MKVAIVHDFLTKTGGAEKVLMILHEMFPDAPIYTSLYSAKGTKGVFEKDGYTIIPSYLSKYPDSVIRRPKLFLAKLSKAVESFDLSEYDVVISSSNSFAHGVITKPKTFHITYCHSPMRYAWDWYHEYLRENKIGFGLKGMYIRNILSTTRVWDKVASARTDYWLANSQNVADRIKKYYGKESEVLCPPVDVDKITPNENIGDDYYVIVSRLEPYKKVDLAIKAFNQLGKTLVIIGTGTELSKLQQLANNNIEFLGWQSDASVIEYIRNAKALIFPGEDDFGLTPVEAMAAGRPVVAYGSGGALETVTPGETGVFFKESSEKSLMDAINKFESGITHFSPKKCRKQAEKFSKENFIKKFQEILDREYKNYQNKFE
jgi:glycosyltransferase involved in cell wall biosynthesis